MRFLIIGDGPEERAWASALRARPEHQVAAALARGDDLDAGLAVPDLDAVVVGGPHELRAEALRRAAADGLAIVALHPPGRDADPYYQVALTPLESGAIVVPDLSLRLHPAFEAIRRAIADGSLGVPRSVVYEAAYPAGTDLLGTNVPRVVDAVASLLGEVATVTATGTPGERVVVHLRDARGRSGELRLEAGAPIIEPARLVAAFGEGTLTWEHDPGLDGPSRLVRRASGAEPSATEIAAWDAKGAILDVLRDAKAGQARPPGLVEGTRAMEIAEAAARSLRRGRTVELHRDEISELGSFKAAMTSIGCGLLVVAVLLFVLSRAGLALGIAGSHYLAWGTFALLVVFALLQLLRFAARPAPTAAETSPAVEEPRT
jgi:predicted dehydrogenase